MASIVRYSLAPEGEKNRILFCNPDNLSREDGKEEAGKVRDRKNLSVKVSYDEGRTWPVTRTIEPGPSMYSDIAVAKSGTILCFYDRGTKPGYAGEFITLARFNLEWVTDGKDTTK
jgi:sialidase-1